MAKAGISGIVAALLILQHGPAGALEIRQEQVRFHAGASSATITGAIKGEETIDYRLSARAGQTMTVTLKTSNASASCNVLPPGSDAAIAIGATLDNAWTGTLPVDGDYTVRLFLVRSAARRNETAPYALTIGITGSRDAKVAGTAYHATGMVPCSVGTDPKGSAQCSFGVIRKAPGTAQVHLASPGFDVTLHKDNVETVLNFHGNEVTSADGAQTVTATKNGDDWSIGIDDFRFYTIPDAVIVGG